MKRFLTKNANEFRPYPISSQNRLRFEEQQSEKLWFGQLNQYSITANNEQRSIPVTRCNQQFYVGHFELIWLVATWSVAWEKCRNTSGDAKTRHIHDPIVLLSCVLCTHGLPHLFRVDITNNLINKASIHMAECYITDDHVSNTWPFKRAL